MFYEEEDEDFDNFKEIFLKQVEKFTLESIKNQEINLNSSHQNNNQDEKEEEEGHDNDNDEIEINFKSVENYLKTKDRRPQPPRQGPAISNPKSTSDPIQNQHGNSSKQDIKDINELKGAKSKRKDDKLDLIKATTTTTNTTATMRPSLTLI
ncbi:hypothetical protein O181_015594 [Austropuccinia psidii MF-1]|uniref:Uncharacterized protein n=1 Tax=Austropuccinia psidii MF-1 TaxID=1389203 RepID=A0A9Q3C2A4_9BASI|nr:hypothetical protein [Austropuccinia psidii MF-1]